MFIHVHLIEDVNCDKSRALKSEGHLKGARSLSYRTELLAKSLWPPTRPQPHLPGLVPKMTKTLMKSDDKNINPGMRMQGSSHEKMQKITKQIENNKLRILRVYDIVYTSLPTPTRKDMARKGSAPARKSRMARLLHGSPLAGLL